jgi:membrane-bound metal-dependent hydrolase YbcI (DUF457 family)
VKVFYERIPMPLPLAHGLVGATIVAAVNKDIKTENLWQPILLGAALANAPDLDFFFDAHRMFTHSLAFALVFMAGAVLLLGRSRLREALAYGLAFASHGLLDFVNTLNGNGVQILWPFSPLKYKLGLFGLFEIDDIFSVELLLRSSAIEVLLFAPFFVALWLIRLRRQAADEIRAMGG